MMIGIMMMMIGMIVGMIMSMMIVGMMRRIWEELVFHTEQRVNRQDG